MVPVLTDIHSILCMLHASAEPESCSLQSERPADLASTAGPVHHNYTKKGQGVPAVRANF